MMDEFIHGPIPHLLLSVIYDKWTLMDDWNLDEKLSSKWQQLQHWKPTIPPKKSQWMVNNVELTFSVADTIPWFIISIEQDN